MCWMLNHFDSYYYIAIPLVIDWLDWPIQYFLMSIHKACQIHEVSSWVTCSLRWSLEGGMWQIYVNIFEEHWSSLWVKYLKNLCAIAIVLFSTSLGVLLLSLILIYMRFYARFSGTFLAYLAMPIYPSLSSYLWLHIQQVWTIFYHENEWRLVGFIHIWSISFVWWFMRFAHYFLMVCL